MNLTNLNQKEKSKAMERGSNLILTDLRRSHEAKMGYIDPRKSAQSVESAFYCSWLFSRQSMAHVQIVPT
jgi:hypothetical protein